MADSKIDATPFTLIEAKIKAKIFSRLGLSFTQAVLDYVYAVLANF